MQELNYNVYYSYKVIDNYVWYNYILSYNMNNLTYYLGSYNIKVNNYSQFINEVELNLLNCLNIKKKDIVTINPVFNLANL